MANMVRPQVSLDSPPIARYNLAAVRGFFRRCTLQFSDYLSVAQIILSVALIAAIILQSKDAGLGGLTGADTGGVFRARRGVERTLFFITIGLAIAFFGVAIINVITS